MPVSKEVKSATDGGILPTVGVRNGITEHVEEHGLTQNLKTYESSRSLRLECLSGVEDRCDPPLLVERQQWYQRLLDYSVRNGWIARAGCLAHHVIDEGRGSDPVEQITAVDPVGSGPKHAETGRGSCSLQLGRHVSNRIEIR